MHSSATATSVSATSAAPTLSSLREEARRQGMTRTEGRRSALRLGIVAVAYAAISVALVAIDETIVWIAGYVVLGLLFTAIAGSLHENVHGLLFSSSAMRRAWRMVVSFLIMTPVAIYTPYHIAHHAHLDTEKDPEGLHRMPSRLHYLIAVVLAAPHFFIYQLWGSALRTAFGRPPEWVKKREQIREVRVDIVISLLAIVVAVVGTMWSPLVAQLWLIPFAVTACGWLFLFLLPEHLDPKQESVAGRDARTSSRTTHTNRLTSAVLFGFNYHGAHHAYPEIRGPRLREVDRTFRQMQPAEWQSPGYLRYHWRLLRSLPWLPSSGS